MGHLLHSTEHRNEETPMKNPHTAENLAEPIAEGKYFLIWIGLWIVALLALLPR